jgi:two-component system phosphate regulon response regulator PhoB
MAGQIQAAGRRVVVVEDEKDIGSLLEHVLAVEGFRVSLARTGRDAIEEIGRETPDVLVLDLMLPDMSGLEVLRHVRRVANGKTPRVIILSARTSEDDRLAGFKLGANDYISKPFSPRELIYRIRVALQQTPEEAGPATKLFEAGPIRVDLEQHEVRVSGRIVPLTLTEFRLLADLVRNEGRVRTRGMLMTEVWGYDSEAMSRTVDTHVRRLRRKLGPAASWVSTVRGIGYSVRDPDRS